MRDGHFRRIHDRVSGIPHPPAQIDFLVVVKELLVEPADLFQQSAANHYAASGLPVNRPFGLALPPYIDVGGKEIRDIAERSKIQSCNQLPANSWEGSSRLLIGTVRIQDPTAECASLRVAIREFNPLVQRSLMDVGVRIEN